MTYGPETDTKPAIKSTTIWANVLTGIIGVVAILPQVISDITPIISPQTAIILSVVTNLFTTFQRATGQQKQIAGIVNQK